MQPPTNVHDQDFWITFVSALKIAHLNYFLCCCFHKLNRMTSFPVSFKSQERCPRIRPKKRHDDMMMMDKLQKYEDRRTN